MDWWLLTLLAVLFLWAVAEVMMWPIIPDAALAATAFFLPEMAVPGLVGVVVGSAIGGAVGITLIRSGRSYPLPMVTARMEMRVERWLGKGPLGLMYQPPTAVPYKVFVVEAARRGFHRSTWAALTILFRGSRMAFVTLAAVGSGRLTESLAPDSVLTTKLVIAGIAAGVFLAGWRLAFVIWSRPQTA